MLVTCWAVEANGLVFPSPLYPNLNVKKHALIIQPEEYSPMKTVIDIEITRPHLQLKMQHELHVLDFLPYYHSAHQHQANQEQTTL